MALTEIILLALKMFFRSNPPEVFIGKVFWKYAANVQENTHAKMRFQ